MLQLLHHCVSIVGEFTYWSRAVIPPNPTFIVNTVPFQEPRLIYPLEGSAVSATSYALLVYLANNRIEEATSIMKWLQTMRNSIGGWGSTQVHSFIIARQPSCGKVMFSVVCVRLLFRRMTHHAGLDLCPPGPLYRTPSPRFQPPSHPDMFSLGLL